jgi:hypothetical protein
MVFPREVENSVVQQAVEGLRKLAYEEREHV